MTFRLYCSSPASPLSVLFVSISVNTFTSWFSKLRTCVRHIDLYKPLGVCCCRYRNIVIYNEKRHKHKIIKLRNNEIHSASVTSEADISIKLF